ncbi:MAG: 23S rRNA (pseudouridine(1915)-N(3))-methyltransferase RlmH [Symbiobacteriia bacterium]
MNLRLISVGRIKEKSVQAAMAEYTKRLQAYGRIELVQVADESVPDRPSAAEAAALLATEGERILRQVPRSSHLVVLDVSGSQMTSEEFAAYLERVALGGQSEASFVVGGTLGLAPAVSERAALRLSLSRLTFTHQLVPLILLEQLFRAAKIQRGETYHR